MNNLNVNLALNTDNENAARIMIYFNKIILGIEGGRKPKQSFY